MGLCASQKLHFHRSGMETPNKKSLIWGSAESSSCLRLVPCSVLIVKWTRLKIISFAGLEIDQTDRWSHFQFCSVWDRYRKTREPEQIPCKWGGRCKVQCWCLFSCGAPGTRFIFSVCMARVPVTLKYEEKKNRVQGDPHLNKHLQWTWLTR